MRFRITAVNDQKTLTQIFSLENRGILLTVQAASIFAVLFEGLRLALNAASHMAIFDDLINLTAAVCCCTLTLLLSHIAGAVRAVQYRRKGLLGVYWVELRDELLSVYYETARRMEEYPASQITGCKKMNGFYRLTVDGHKLYLPAGGFQIGTETQFQRWSADLAAKRVAG